MLDLIDFGISRFLGILWYGGIIFGVIVGLIIIGTAAFMIGGVKMVLIVQWLMVIGFFGFLFLSMS